MQKYLPVLRNCPFFTGLTDDEILSILHCVSAVKITRPRGSYIFRAGDSTEVMGLVLSGSTLVIFGDTAISCPSAIPETFSANLTPPPPVPS